MNQTNPVFLSSQISDDYPSGSTLSYVNDRFFVMGDDAAEILVLNSDLKEVGRIGVFDRTKDLRSPKAIKADIEASVVLKSGSILFFGSGSLSPHRDSAFVLDPEKNVLTRISASEFYDVMRGEVSELNIEAAALVDDNVLLGLRANNTHPDNYIAFADFTNSIFHYRRKIKIHLPFKDAGISGMDYDENEDVLLITFSSEDTANSIDDGEIGESYLAIVLDAKKLLKDDRITISHMIKLSDLSSEFVDQKIESVSLTNEKRKLLLVADDDKGNTKLFFVKY